MTTMDVKPKVQSLGRGLRILEHIADQSHPVRLAELSELLGVEKSSAYRLVATLADRGYVRKDSQTDGYVLYKKVFELAGKLVGYRLLKEYAPKYLEALATKTGETSHLAILSSGKVLLIDYRFGSRPIGVTSQSGRVEPIHCTALGKALLAGCDLAQLCRILDEQPLQRYTPKTITSLTRLAAECRAAMCEGLAFDNEEFHNGVRCVASPVFDFSGKVVAALGISGPAANLPVATLKKHGLNICACALELSKEMGYQPNEQIKKEKRP